MTSILYDPDATFVLGPDALGRPIELDGLEYARALQEHDALGDSIPDEDFERLFALDDSDDDELDDFPMSLEYEDMAGVDDFTNEATADREAVFEFDYWDGGV